MVKKRSDALYNRMRNGKEDLEEYYKERERFCNDTTCKGHGTKGEAETHTGIRMVTHFEGSSILPEDKRKYDVKWNAKLLEFGKLMEEKGLSLMKEMEGKAQEEKKAGGELGKYKRPMLSDIVDKAKLRCEIFKWRKLTRITSVFIMMMTLWIAAHLSIILFMYIVCERQLDLKRIMTLCAGCGIGMVIHWAIYNKIESLMVKAYAKDKDWADRIRGELKGWDLRC